MNVIAPAATLDPAPRRPDTPLDAPPSRLMVEVRVDVAHLANPAVAVSRLLASEANAHAHVHGDESRLVVSVALRDDQAATRRDAEAWVRWALHNAGIRGRIGLCRD